MKNFEILFCFLIFDFIFSETKVFKQVKQASAQRNLHIEASEKYTKYMTDIMQVRAEQLNLDRNLIQKDIERLKKDPIFKHKGVYGVVPVGKSGRLNVIHNIEQVVNKRPAKLTQSIKSRFKTRKPNPGQQKCGLWVKVGYMQYYPGFKQARAKLIFRSNCMNGPEIKYFILRNQQYIPQFLEFKIGDKTFKIKYDQNSYKQRGHGTHMQQQFQRYKLYTFFKVKYKLTRDQREEIKRKQVEINKNKCFDTCRYQRGHRRTICYQRCKLRHRYVKRSRYLKEISLNQNQKENLNLQKLEKESQIKEQSQPQEQPQDNIKLSEGRKLEEVEAKKNKKQIEDQKKDIKKDVDNKERNLKLETSKKKNKKNRELRLCDCRYCYRKKFNIEKQYCKRACDARCRQAQDQMSSQDRQVMHLPNKYCLQEDEILSPGNHENQTGFFNYQIVDAIWNSASEIRSNRRYENEQTMYTVVIIHRGRPINRRQLKRRCVLYGSVA